jgi:hypothetical protein
LWYLHFFNVQCYVTSFHDFCHDSAKFEQVRFYSRCSKSSML